MDEILHPIPDHDTLIASLKAIREKLASAAELSDQELFVLACDALRHSSTYEERGYR